MSFSTYCEMMRDVLTISLPFTKTLRSVNKRWRRCRQNRTFWTSRKSLPARWLLIGISSRKSTTGRLNRKLYLVWHRVLSTEHTRPVSYTHLRAHETPEHLVCRL